MKYSFPLNCDLFCALHFHTYILIFTLLEKKKTELKKMKTFPLSSFAN